MYQGYAVFMRFLFKNCQEVNKLCTLVWAWHVQRKKRPLRVIRPQCMCHESKPWTLLHSPPEVTLTSLDSHTVTDHPLRLHLPSFTAPSQLFHIISLHLFTIIQSPSHYINPEHSATLCRVLLASYLTKRFPSFLSLFPCVPIPPLPLDYSLCLPSGLSLPIADPRLPKDYSSVLSMPYPFAPARPCLYWPWC